MNILTHKKSIMKLGIGAVLIASIMASWLVFATSLHAADPEPNEKDVKCTLEMKPFIKTEGDKFRTYLQAHFKNKSKNSSLLDLALKRFEIYKQTLWNKAQNYYPQSGLPVLSESTDALQCIKLVKNDINISEELLKQYFLETSDIKTTSILMTKLEKINKKLDGLNRQVIQMLGKWETLKDRIPCFTGKCISG
ncbi:hypothetical protein ACFL3C_03355 [Patescibacteria group bacterium]